MARVWDDVCCLLSRGLAVRVSVTWHRFAVMRGHGCRSVLGVSPRVWALGVTAVTRQGEVSCCVR